MNCLTLATTLLLSLVFVSAALSQEDTLLKPWYEQSLVGMEVGPTGAQFGHSDIKDMRYAAKFNGREIVRRCVAANCEYVVIWARDGDYAYYNSKLLPKTVGLGQRDTLREAVDEARKSKIPILAYCVVQQGGHYLDAHREFEMRGMDGKRIGRFCYNSGYLEAMKPILAEMLAYGIDGFHIDMLDQGFGKPYGCWCDTCQQKFERKYGHRMPTSASWDTSWDEMLEFRYETSATFERALYAYVKSINPNASVDFNYHGNPPFSFEVGQRPVQHAANADFVTGETGQWGFSALGVGLNAEFYRASTPGKPFQVAMQRGVRMYHDQTTRPLADIRWELFTLLAHGAFVTMVDKTSFDGKLDPAAYDRIGEAFKEARAENENFRQHPVYDVGLYFSSRTRDWYGRETPAMYFQSFEGAHKACVYEHLTFGVVLDENVTLEALKQFPVVCLANVTILSTREVDLLHRYVEEGGKLLITGQSGQYDPMGKPLNETMLTDIVGAKVIGRLETQDNWVRFHAADSKSPLGSLCAPIRPDWPFLVQGPATIYRPGIAAYAGELMAPFRNSRQLAGLEPTDWPTSAESPVGPAVLIHNLGKGRVLTFAGSPDFSTASEHAITETRKLFASAVRFLNPDAPVEVTAPANVESVVTDDVSTRTIRVHLIAYNSLPQSTPANNRAVCHTRPRRRYANLSSNS